MNLTDKKRLILLIEALADSEKSRRKRKSAGQALARLYPPTQKSALYANILRDGRLSDRGRWVVMLMLYYVGDDEAVRGFLSFYADPEMPDALKLDVILFAVSLNPRLQLKLNRDALRFPLSWLIQGFRNLPPMPADERRSYVLDRLVEDLFEERKLS